MSNITTTIPVFFYNLLELLIKSHIYYICYKRKRGDHMVNLNHSESQNHDDEYHQILRSLKGALPKGSEIVKSRCNRRKK